MYVHSHAPMPARPEPAKNRYPARYPAIQTLIAFETAARLGSFTRAAEALFLTQSAVTHQIKALEGYLGAKLFDRQGRGVALTAAGEAIYEDITLGLQVIGRSLVDARARRHLA